MHKRARCADSFVFWLSTWNERLKLHVIIANYSLGLFPPLATVESKHKNLNDHDYSKLSNQLLLMPVQPHAHP